MLLYERCALCDVGVLQKKALKVCTAEPSFVKFWSSSDIVYGRGRACFCPRQCQIQRDSQYYPSHLHCHQNKKVSRSQWKVVEVGRNSVESQ